MLFVPNNDLQAFRNFFERYYIYYFIYIKKGGDSMVNYHNNGVIIYPAVPSTKSNFQITYNGLLPQNGATEVYAHVGYGRSWENVQDYKMTKTNHGFEVSIPMWQHADSLNICFKDAANNWDNNTGTNYSFVVSNPHVNSSLEFADEISPADDMSVRCRSNLAIVKTAISRWLGSAD